MTDEVKPEAVMPSEVPPLPLEPPAKVVVAKDGGILNFKKNGQFATGSKPKGPKVDPEKKKTRLLRQKILAGIDPVQLRAAMDKAMELAAGGSEKHLRLILDRLPPVQISEVTQIQATPDEVEAKLKELFGLDKEDA